MIVAIVEQTK